MKDIDLQSPHSIPDYLKYRSSKDEHLLIQAIKIKSPS